MHSKHFFFLIVFSLFLLNAKTAYCQSDKNLVISTIDQFFAGMKKGDSSMVSAVMSPQARLLTVVEKEGKVFLPEVPLEKLLNAVGSPHEEVWDERIHSYEVKIDDRLSSVWTTYSFYLGEKFSHCGVNAFQLYKSEAGWKIIEITDTRRVENCP
jgi:hypothetical protein